VIATLVVGVVLVTIAVLFGTSPGAAGGSSGHGDDHRTLQSELPADDPGLTAIIDRLEHHAPVLSINGDIYRMRAHRDAIASLRGAITGGEPSRSHLGNSRDR
jgi:hypothetical protein